MKIKLSIKQHNRIFKYRKVKLLTYYEIVDDPQKREIEMYQYIRLPIRILAIALSPLVILVGGVPAMIQVVKECTTNKQCGADSVNRFWFYKELEKVK